ncbi:hypothetical protein [uncultured Sphingomonas sp.]|uniref:hypothetical protein n=1 Tax=uncultured Sphingomonas sp. TaxID=158754 RepID=UPI0025EC4BBF|nr:hypothetical protein [uncultured Sphingomonas sp.]
MARISIASAKAKGRNLQKWVVTKVLAALPTLEPDDVRSCPLGSGGVDVILSPAAKRQHPYSYECKARANGFTPVYDALDQASRGDGLTPIAVIKQDRRRPLVVMDAEVFYRLISNDK